MWSMYTEGVLTPPDRWSMYTEGVSAPTDDGLCIQKECQLLLTGGLCIQKECQPLLVDAVVYTLIIHINVAVTFCNKAQFNFSTV